jgi:3-methylfumaryl-CoA hydratase
MWAGGRVAFRAPLRVGDTISRESRIVDIRERQGRTGSLVFVVVRHTISNAGGIAVVDEQDIVYRDGPGTDRPKASSATAPIEATWSREIDPDPVLLFRYSALTFNGHRIHYDRRYATEVEGYPGLVVHGPLIATLLMELLHHARHDARVRNFSYRAVSPLFDTEPFFVRGEPAVDGTSVHLWAQTTHGALAMDATATVS